MLIIISYSTFFPMSYIEDALYNVSVFLLLPNNYTQKYKNKQLLKAASKKYDKGGYTSHETVTVTEQESIQEMKYWLSQGAAINACDEQGKTPLWWSIHHYRYLATKFLLENGTEPNRSFSMYAMPLIEACRKRLHNIVKLLLNYGAMVDIPEVSNLQRTITPLYPLTQSGHAQLVLLLLSYGASIDNFSTSSSIITLLPQSLYPRSFLERNRDAYLLTLKALLAVGCNPNPFSPKYNKSFIEIIDDKKARQLLKHPFKVKKYCSKEEKEQITAMKKQRRKVLLHKSCGPSAQHLINELQKRELKGYFTRKKEISKIQFPLKEYT